MNGTTLGRAHLFFLVRARTGLPSVLVENNFFPIRNRELNKMFGTISPLNITFRAPDVE